MEGLKMKRFLEIGVAAVVLLACIAMECFMLLHLSLQRVLLFVAFWYAAGMLFEMALNCIDKRYR